MLCKVCLESIFVGKHSLKEKSSESPLCLVAFKIPHSALSFSQSASSGCVICHTLYSLLNESSRRLLLEKPPEFALSIRGELEYARKDVTAYWWDHPYWTATKGPQKSRFTLEDIYNCSGRNVPWYKAVTASSEKCCRYDAKGRDQPQDHAIAPQPACWLTKPTRIGPTITPVSISG
jgi:hypothetical protein